MKRRALAATAGRSWPGVLSIALAVASVAMYWIGTLVPDNPYSSGQFGNFAVSTFQLGTATSALVGFLAVRRARQGGGGLVVSIIGLVVGSTLTFLWVAWFGMLVLDPGAMD
jgi:hypothetical protein